MKWVVKLYKRFFGLRWTKNERIADLRARLDRVHKYRMELEQENVKLKKRLEQ